MEPFLAYGGIRTHNLPGPLLILTVDQACFTHRGQGKYSSDCVSPLLKTIW